MNLDKKIKKMIENKELEKGDEKYYRRLMKERKAYEKENREHNET